MLLNKEANRQGEGGLVIVNSLSEVTDSGHQGHVRLSLRNVDKEKYRWNLSYTSAKLQKINEDN